MKYLYSKMVGHTRRKINITLETFCCLSRKNFRSIFSFFERFKFSFYNHALLDVHNLRHIPVKMFFFFLTISTIKDFIVPFNGSSHQQFIQHSVRKTKAYKFNSIQKQRDHRFQRPSYRTNFSLNLFLLLQTWNKGII